jgi:hypothetical protein
MSINNTKSADNTIISQNIDPNKINWDDVAAGVVITPPQNILDASNNKKTNENKNTETVARPRPVIPYSHNGYANLT